MKKVTKKQTVSYMALEKVSRLQELLKITQNAEVATYSENQTPDAYDKNRKFIDDTKKEIFSLLERIKTNIEYI